MPYSPWFILAVNAMPVFAVLGFGWSAFSLMLLYWLENVIIGVVNLLKILITSFTSPSGFLGVIIAPFFVFHYGLFCFVHGVFVFALFGVTGAQDLAGISDPASMPGVILSLLEREPGFAYGAAWLAAAHLIGFVVFWLGHREWRGSDPATQMFEPYGRIVLLHVVLLVAAVPVLVLGQPLIGVLLLAVLKTAVELNWWRIDFPVDREKIRASVAEAASKFRLRGGGPA